MSELEKEFGKFCSNKFGKDLDGRFRKFLEEAGELLGAFQQYTISPTDESLAHLKDELSDVQAVISHIGHLLGTNSQELIQEAKIKIETREVDNNFRRY